MNPHTQQVDQIRSFNRFYTNIIGVVDHHILQSDFSLTDVRIMYEIFTTADLTARKLKALLCVNEGYLSHTLNRLTKNNIVSRTQAPNDKRLYFLSLTAKGSAIINKLNQQSNEAIELLIQDLSEDEVQELTRNMSRIKAILNKKEKDHGID